MTKDDFANCEFVYEYLRFVTYDDFYKNRNVIKAFFNIMDKNGKRFYKWYVYANIFIDEQRKNAIWSFLNLDDPDTIKRLESLRPHVY